MEGKEAVEFFLENRRCEYCIYWKPYYQRDIGWEEGFCRRYPPKIFEADPDCHPEYHEGTRGSMPTTYCKEWCGEWKSSPEYLQKAKDAWEPREIQLMEDTKRKGAYLPKVECVLGSYRYCAVVKQDCIEPHCRACIDVDQENDENITCLCIGKAVYTDWHKSKEQQ